MSDLLDQIEKDVDPKAQGAKKSTTTKEIKPEAPAKEAEKKEVEPSGDAQADLSAPLPQVKEVKPKDVKAKAKPETSTKEVKVEEVTPANEFGPNFEPDPNKVYVFKLKKDSTKYVMPNTSTILCPETNSIRTIRLVTTGDTVFVDEQDELARLALPLIFTHGEVSIQGTNKLALRYLFTHEGFKGKKNTLPENRFDRDLYEYVDTDAAKEANIKRQILVAQALTKVSTATESEIETYVHSLGFTYLTGSDATLKALDLAKASPQNLLNQFENPRTKILANIHKLVEKGTLVEDYNKLILKTTGDAIVTAEKGKSVYAKAVDEVVAKSKEGLIIATL